MNTIIASSNHYLSEFHYSTNFDTAWICSTKDKTLNEITESDFIGHEKFESKEKMLETYRFYYGNIVKKDTFVKMINFKLLNIF